jgi:hypothetical protein
MPPIQLLALLASVPPEIAGLPTWALNGLSIGSLVSFVLIGLATARLWTKRQVDELVKQHEREMKTTVDSHTRETAATAARYELHLTRTVEMWKGRTDDALAREKEWKDVARQWEATATMLSQGLEPLQDQGETMLRIVQAWQSESRRREIGQ